MSRQDLVAAVDAYRAASHLRANWLPASGVFGGLLLGLLLLMLGERLHWPAWLEPVFFAFGWAVTLASLGIVFRKNRQLIERCQCTCPKCNTSLIAASGLNPLARAEMAIAGGHCPVCGEKLF